MLCCRSPPDMRAVGENVDARALQGSQLSRHYSLRGNTNRKCPREVSRVWPTSSLPPPILPSLHPCYYLSPFLFTTFFLGDRVPSLHGKESKHHDGRMHLHPLDGRPRQRRHIGHHPVLHVRGAHNAEPQQHLLVVPRVDDGRHAWHIHRGHAAPVPRMQPMASVGGTVDRVRPRESGAHGAVPRERERSQEEAQRGWGGSGASRRRRLGVDRAAFHATQDTAHGAAGGYVRWRDTPAILRGHVRREESAVRRVSGVVPTGDVEEPRPGTAEGGAQADVPVFGAADTQARRAQGLPEHRDFQGRDGLLLPRQGEGGEVHVVPRGRRTAEGTISSLSCSFRPFVVWKRPSNLFNSISNLFPPTSSCRWNS